MVLKFIYFDLVVRALGPVLALELFDVEWEREKFEKWVEAKQDTDKYPFGQVPVLLDGDMTVAHSAAIGNYIARKAGKVPQDEKDLVMSDMLLVEFESLMRILAEGVPTIYVKLGERGKGNYEHYVKTEKEILPAQFEHLERLIEKRGTNGSFTSTGKSVGEIFLFAVLHQVLLVFPTVLEGFPKLKAFQDAFLADSKVQAVLAGESGFGPMPQYFVPAPPQEGDVC